jgi:hypothetical protein
MTYEACIRFAPYFTIERLEAGPKNGRTLYDKGGLRFLPGVETVPLLVDHDEDLEVGFVDKLWHWDDIDGPWCVARATVTKPPAWLTRGTKASFAFSKMWTASREDRAVYERIVRRYREDAPPMDWKYVHKGLVSEVSILSPGTKPAEPLAQVLLVERTSAAEPAGKVIHTPSGVLVRRHSGHVIGVR